MLGEMIRFSLCGIPVHIHPSFWGAALAWGVALTLCEPQLLVVPFFALAFFVSLLVHELGHALAGRWLIGSRVGVYLSWLGGACCSEEAPECSRSRGLIITMAGPLAGFLLAGAICGGVVALAPDWPVAGRTILCMLLGHAPIDMVPEWPPLLVQLVVYVLQISIWWGLLNMLPIFPLDGGLVLHALMGDTHTSHVISMVATCLPAVLFIATGVWALAALMLVLAYYNYRCILVHIE